MRFSVEYLLNVASRPVVLFGQIPGAILGAASAAPGHRIKGFLVGSVIGFVAGVAIAVLEDELGSTSSSPASPIRADGELAPGFTGPPQFLAGSRSDGFDPTTGAV